MRITSFFLSLVLMVTCSLPITANAYSTASYTAAQELNKLGLLEGIGQNPDLTTNYDLDREPTRAEAVVMIIALSGSRDSALQSNYPHTFKDAGWADSYIGYAKYMGISDGLSSDQFGTNNLITQHEFLTMLLKSMGYSVKDWQNPYPEAEVAGLYTSGDSWFNRGHMALICRSALDANLSSGQTLMTYLSSIGYFDSLIVTTPDSGSTGTTSTPSTAVVPFISEITVTSSLDAAEQFVKVAQSGTSTVTIYTPRGSEEAIQSYIFSQLSRYEQVSHVSSSWVTNSGKLTIGITYHDAFRIILFLQGKTETISTSDRQTLEAAQNLYHSTISSNMTEIEKVTAIHNAIINNTAYQYTGDNAHTAYGVFVDGLAVCDGYAKAFLLLTYMAGIDATRVIGYAGENHSWNMVKVNGSWYHIDLTWDDPISIRPVLRYDYFLISDETISADHSWTRYDHLPTCPMDYYAY